MITQRVAYTRYVYTCDNCGRQENVIRSEEDPRDDLPLVNGWMLVPLADFTRNERHACSRRCAEAIAMRAIDSAVTA